MIPGLETLLGSLLGGIFRFATAWMESREKQRDRDHEFRMTELHGEQAERAAEWRAREIGMYADMALHVVDTQAIIEAVKSQSAEAQAAGGFAAFLSSTVRPIVTYLFVGLYAFHKIMQVRVAVAGGDSMLYALSSVYTQSDQAIMATVIGFWFVDRALRHGLLNPSGK